MKDILDLVTEGINKPRGLIDGRDLTLELRITEATIEDSKSAAMIVVERFIEPLYRICICDMSVNGRNFKLDKALHLFYNNLNEGKVSDFCGDFFFKDGWIKTRRDLTAFNYPPYGYTSEESVDNSISADYKCTLKDVFGDRLDSPCDKESFMELLKIKKTAFITKPKGAEFSFEMSFDKSTHVCGKVCFSLSVNFSVASFESDELIELVEQSARDIAIINSSCKGMVNASAPQRVSRSACVHANIFSNPPIYSTLKWQDQSLLPFEFTNKKSVLNQIKEYGKDLVDARDWYEDEYMLGAEWLNIVPNKLVSVVNQSIEQAKSDEALQVDELPNGICIVKMRKSPLDIYYSDAMNMRRIFAPVLMPGIGKAIDRAWNIRKKWNIIPVEPNEFTVFPNGTVVFAYGLKNAPYINKENNTMLECPVWRLTFS